MSVQPNSNNRIISVGQALLLLMDKFKDKPEKLEELEKLYLSGPLNFENGEEDAVKLKKIDEYIADEYITQKYIVSKDPKIINDDDARRFFETHLSLETLNHSLKDLSKNRLEEHLEKLKKRLPEQQKKELEAILKGLKPKSDDLMQLEKELGGVNLGGFKMDHRSFAISELVRQMNNDSAYARFTAEEKDKIKLLVTLSLVGVEMAIGRKGKNSMPADDLYSNSAVFQGREQPKPGSATTRSNVGGIMRGHAPLPLNDPTVTNRTPSITKASDKSTYNIETAWAKKNFALLVHPFSNSISGTFFTQLSAILDLQQQYLEGLQTNNVLKQGDNKIVFEEKDEMDIFLKCMITGLLYKSGGHTLYEFVGPFLMPKVQELFTQSAINLKRADGNANPFDIQGLNLETLFYDGSRNPSKKDKAPFSKALQETREYNKMLLKRQALLKDLGPAWTTKYGKTLAEKDNKPSIAAAVKSPQGVSNKPSQTVQATALTSLQPKETKTLVEGKIKEEYLSLRDNEGNTPLILAIRQHKNDLAKRLLASYKPGSNDIRQHKNMRMENALFEAIREGNPEMVEILLKHQELKDAFRDKNHRGKTPLQLAFEVVGGYEEQISKFSSTTTKRPVELGLKVINLLLQDKEVLKSINEQDEQGRTVLHSAITYLLKKPEGLADKNIIEMIDALLKNGANPNLVDGEGYPPLLLAIENEVIFKTLFKAHSEEDILKIRVQPLFISDIVSTEPFQKDNNLLIYLARYASMGGDKALKFVFENLTATTINTMLDQRDEKGNTFFHFVIYNAIENYESAFFEFLLNDPIISKMIVKYIDVKNNKGISPLDMLDPDIHSDWINSMIMKSTKQEAAKETEHPSQHQPNTPEPLVFSKRPQEHETHEPKTHLPSPDSTSKNRP